MQLGSRKNSGTHPGKKPKLLKSTFTGCFFRFHSQAQSLKNSFQCELWATVLYNI